jgi:hypothetical protein
MEIANGAFTSYPRSDSFVLCYCVFFLQSYFQGDDDGEEEMRVGLISLFHFRFSLSGWLAGWLSNPLPFLSARGRFVVYSV